MRTSKVLFGADGRGPKQLQEGAQLLRIQHPVLKWQPQQKLRDSTIECPNQSSSRIQVATFDAADTGEPVKASTQTSKMPKQRTLSRSSTANSSPKRDDPNETIVERSKTFERRIKQHVPCVGRARRTAGAAPPRWPPSCSIGLSMGHVQLRVNLERGCSSPIGAEVAFGVPKDSEQSGAISRRRQQVHVSQRDAVKTDGSTSIRSSNQP